MILAAVAVSIKAMLHISAFLKRLKEFFIMKKAEAVLEDIKQTTEEVIEEMKDRAEEKIVELEKRGKDKLDKLLAQIRGSM